MSARISTHRSTSTNAKGIGDLPIGLLVGPGLRRRPAEDGPGRLRPLRPRALRALGARHRHRDRARRHPDHPYRLPPLLPGQLDGLSAADETKYFIRHPGPTREFAEWVKARGIRWLAVDAGSADHPMNTVIRQVRPDVARKRRPSSAARSTRSCRRTTTRSCTRLLFPHDMIHIENLGGEIDDMLDQRVRSAAFRGGSRAARLPSAAPWHFWTLAARKLCPLPFAAGRGG